MDSSQVIAALEFPLVIDDSGNLFLLRGDGATVCVHERREGSRSWQEWYVAAHCGTRCSWVASNSTLYLVLSNSKPYVVDCSALPGIGGVGAISDKGVVFSLPCGEEFDLVVWSGTEGVGGFLVTRDEVRLVFCVPGVMAFDGMLQGQNLTLFGMTQRVVDGSRGAYEVRKRGRAARVHVDLETGKVSVAKDDHTKQMTRAAVQDAIGKKLSWWAADPQVEYWLGLIGDTRKSVVLGVVDDVHISRFPFYNPDLEAMGQYPAASEALGLGLYVLTGDSVADAPDPYLHLAYCISRVRRGNEVCAYVQRHDERARLESVFRLSLNRAGDPELQPLMVNWASVLPPGDSVLATFRVSHFDVIGYIAVAFFVQTGSEGSMQILLRSEDGLVWHARHELKARGV